MLTSTEAVERITVGDGKQRLEQLRDSAVLNHANLLNIIGVNDLKYDIATTQFSTVDLFDRIEIARTEVVFAANALSQCLPHLDAADYRLRWVASALPAYQEKAPAVAESFRLLPEDAAIHVSAFRQMQSEQQATNGKAVAVSSGLEYAGRVSAGEIFIIGGSLNRAMLGSLGLVAPPALEVVRSSSRRQSAA